jgi:hypothetical protein
MTTFCITFYESYLSTVQDNRVKIKWSYWAPTYEHILYVWKFADKGCVICNKEGWIQKTAKGRYVTRRIFFKGP